jgi:hypothetical protein
VFTKSQQINEINQIMSAVNDEYEPIPDEYTTVSDVFPIRIPLEKADFGKLKYEAVIDGDLYDIELLYELQTSDMLVRCAISSFSDATTGPGTFRIRGIEAAKLELVNEIPGTLEGISARLVLEISQDVQFNQFSGKSEGVKLKAHKIILTASVHETGHLRDILLFLKSNKITNFLCHNSSDTSTNAYFNPQRSKTSPSLNRSQSLDSSQQPSLTFLETIPWWAIHIPWWLYSRQLRKYIQMILLIYTVFTILWASWQLYRHVEVIQKALQPIVDVLYWYLYDIMTALDVFLDSLTHYWTCLLSPLNIFRSLLFIPVWNLLIQVRVFLVPLWYPLVRCFTPFSHCLQIIWQFILNSKLAVQSIDMNKIQQSFVFNLIFSCFKAFGNGLSKFVGYFKSKSKQNEAIKQQRMSMSSPVVSLTKRHSNSVPVYYNSPLTRKEIKDN